MLIQNACALLPSAASYAAYYWIQRHFGGLKNKNPVTILEAGVQAWNLIIEEGHNPEGKVFFEVGTGRVPLVPLAFWLLGAEKTITIDLNPYMKEELVAEDLAYISLNEASVAQLFGANLNRERWLRLLEFSRSSTLSLRKFLDLCRVEYIAPRNAADTKLSNHSIDYHTSYTVFEHIPPTILRDILLEGNRIVRPGGLFVHRIDYSDHFSHSDESISAINFLQYSDRQWNRYAGNRYMYMNRLRHDDYLRIYEDVGHNILSSRLFRDEKAFGLIRNGGLELDERFRSKSEDILATTGAWMITQQM